MQLTWDTQTPVAVAHTATDPVGTGVQGTEVHQLGTSGTGEARCAATAEPQGARALSVACSIIVTGAGGTRVHLLLTCSTLVTCKRSKAETRVGNCKTERGKHSTMPGRKEKLWQDGNAANTRNIINNSFSKSYYVQVYLLENIKQHFTQVKN